MRRSAETSAQASSEGLAFLRAADFGLAQALEVIGAPVVRRRPGGFEGLFRIVVEQQLSVESARAILARCQAQLGAPLPETVLAAPEDALRACGLSRPKIGYLRGVAEAVLDERLDLLALGRLPDEDAAAALTAIRGIGPWTAAIYLLFCEGRTDIWPRSDVALLAAYTAAAGGEKPAMRDFDASAQAWAPHRGTAAHILWTYYAHLKGRVPG